MEVRNYWNAFDLYFGLLKKKDDNIEKQEDTHLFILFLSSIFIRSYFLQRDKDPKDCKSRN
jgi:hypothetical protein